MLLLIPLHHKSCQVLRWGNTVQSHRAPGHSGVLDSTTIQCLSVSSKYLGWYCVYRERVGWTLQTNAIEDKAHCIAVEHTTREIIIEAVFC